MNHLEYDKSFLLKWQDYGEVLVKPFDPENPPAHLPQDGSYAPHSHGFCCFEIFSETNEGPWGWCGYDYFNNNTVETQP